MDPALFIQPEDLIKISNVLLDNKQMTGELKEQMLTTVDNNIRQYNYEVFSELAVLFATKMDNTYRELFFNKFMDKFLQELEFLDDTILYKMLWSFIKAGRF